MPFQPIAIVGRSCVLPGALSPEDLWSAVLNGRDLLTPAPRGRWRSDPSHLVSARSDGAKDVAWSDRGGYVAGFESVFDMSGFELPPGEIEGLDPLFQWTLHCARAALAGSRRVRRERTGLILGNLSFPSSALSALAESVWFGDDEAAGIDPRNRFMSGLPAHLAARALGLGGEAFALDAACASSFYAMKLACDRLHDGSVDAMLAGAVNRADDLFIHVGFTALNALSPSGRSRPFQRDADGLVPAEGAALVLLKRLPDAVRDDDQILGVIRSIGLSNDGRGAGILAPSEEGQKRALHLAYEAAGLRPMDVSLIECHATGTPVGDGVELRSTSAVYEGLRDVPIGSIKSNLGHLITVAGAAGLLKVLAALEARTRPPSIGTDAPLLELEGSPFRLLTKAEPWEASPPRRAALSAFGFGGNNAHVIVEEWREGGEPIASAASTRAPAAPEATPTIAIVGVGVRAADAASAEQLFDKWVSAESSVREDANGLRAGFSPPLALRAAGLRFPPKDLEQALPQQLLVLQAAREALEGVAPLPAQRTSVLTGMQCDAEVARYGARWRAREWLEGTASDDAVEAFQDAIVPALQAPGVIGVMPNICANRLNSQFDLGGPSFTVSSEELSGVRALEIASRALRRHEIDAALVGAVDVAAEPVHGHAASALLDETRHVPGDAAVVLVLKRLEDARRDADQVVALLSEEPGDDALRLDLDGDGATSLTPQFGHSHCASGLLHVAAAALALERRVLPTGGGVPWLAAQGTRTAAIEVTALGGQRSRVSLAQPAHGGRARGRLPTLRVFSGADIEQIGRAIAADRESDSGPARLAVVGRGAQQLKARVDTALSRIGSGTTARQGDGWAYRPRPVEGDIAFVFSGPAGAYRGMGRDLMIAVPELGDALATRFSSVAEAAGWIYEEGDEPEAIEKLWGSSFLCQVHAELTRVELRLQPDAVIGFCSGETNALFAMGAWNDIDAMRREIDEAGIYTRELAGEFEAVRRAWGEPSDTRVRWTSWRLLAPLDQVRRAVDAEPRVHLTIINAPGDCVIGGEPDGCDRVVDAVGRNRARPLGYDIAVHCPELGELEQTWRNIHRRATREVRGVRFYTHATIDHYRPSEQSACEALTGQALGTVDFPALIERAWRDGVRVFIEHGPRDGCSRWIDRILGESREHLAIPLDRSTEGPVERIASALCELAAAGVGFDRALLEPQAVASDEPHPLTLEIPAHRPLPTRPRVTKTPAEELTARHLPVAPGLPPVVAAPVTTMVAPPSPLVAPQPEAPPPPAIRSPTLARIAYHHARVSQTHAQFIALQAETHERFLVQRGATPSRAPLEVRSAPRPLRDVPSVREGPLPDLPAVRAEPPSRGPGRPKFDRADLERLASGKISELFGPLFQEQDGYERQVRMPEPPLLLADRVLDIEGEPGTLGKGTIWTETDVSPDAWYLQEGRMPAGIMIEAGQADLLLISWLGIDLLNKGERVYRLLGCDLMYHGDAPRPGDTLRYDIHVDGHANQGDVRLFFFHYDCRIEGEPRLSVRGGQAGFFTEEELAQTGGVLWDATSEPPPTKHPRIDSPRIEPTRDHFSREEVDAFSEGRALDCFGAGYERTATHHFTPRIGRGRMQLMGEVTQIDPEGGPWGRGYLRSVLAFRPDDWFFCGHFKNDPCMPGTLMFEGCLQGMAFYLAALGFSVDHDSWRFEPVPDETFKLRCRGQALPTSRELVYELFVDELIAEPVPTLYADLLCSVDGVKAFHCRRMGLRLSPDVALERHAEIEATPRPGRAVAVASGVSLDERSLMSCALGQPSGAFGKMYEPFDGARRWPRLPGPPYHFMSRVTRFEGELGEARVGTRVEVEYDVPRDAWYFEGTHRMPFCVLLEAVLQPCGWLALASGVPLESEAPVSFRNLDGTGELKRAIPARDATLATSVELTGVSRSAGMTLVTFDVACRLDGKPLYDMQTGFGFFPDAALQAQVGLPTSDAECAEFAHPPPDTISLDDVLGGAPAICTPRLLMIDDTLGHWPIGGRARLGRWRSDKRIDPREWFFKAHFFRDPVQPGSLGLEAMLQLVQCALLQRAAWKDIPNPRFEPIAIGRELAWKYRGQVVPESAVVSVELELTDVRREPGGALAVGDGWLWVDGKRIYSATGLAMRLVPGE